MKKRWITLLGLLLVFVAIQFIRPAHNKSNQVFPTDFSAIYPVPKNVEGLLKNACYDCHSNNTRYPWYANVQPVGWWLAHHIKEGKAEVNFSEFGSYPHRRQLSKLKNIKSSIQDGSMPPSSYTMIHRNANLSAEDKNKLIGWLEKTRDSLSKEQ
jgi:hypothetical protein